MGKKKNTSGRIRYPGYMEDAHENYIDKIVDLTDVLSLTSPYIDYEDIDIDIAFFGAGYALSSFPSLYDMYGKFMAGLDIEYLFNQAFKDTTDGPIVGGLISEQAAQLSDDMENDVIPRYEVGMRDINAVMGGTFIVGKAMLEAKRVRELSRFAAELRYRMIPVAVERWKAHLEWNKQVVMTYAEIMKFYFTAVLDVDGHNYEMHAKDILWPFTVYDFERLAIGAITGGGAGGVGTAGASRTQKVLGGAMAGVTAGAMVGGPIGAGIGGLLGIAAGFL